MLRMDQVCVVRHKVLVEKLTQREVARQLGISRNTISKYLTQPEPAYRQKNARTKPALEKVVFVYNAGGQLIAEYTSGTPSGGGTSYLTSDHLGSMRVVMRSDGSVARHDYLPFGEEIQGIGGRTAGIGYVAD